MPRSRGHLDPRLRPGPATRMDDGRPVRPRSARPGRSGHSPQPSTQGAFMTVEKEVLTARVVLGWIVEPGNRELFHLVAQTGPVEALAMVVSGKAPKALANAAAARLRRHSPAQ